MISNKTCYRCLYTEVCRLWMPLKDLLYTSKMLSEPKGDLYRTIGREIAITCLKYADRDDFTYTPNL